MTLLWIVLATLLCGLVSTLVASLFLLLPDARRMRLMPHLISFATGAMLAVALIGALPEAVANAGPERLRAVGMAVLGGIVLFFVLEKLVLWRHCHAHDCEAHVPVETQRRRAAAWIVLFGDGVHNLFDGVLIAAAFLTDVKLGVVTVLAICAHEIPQEFGDYAVLLHSGMSRARAFWLNILMSLTSIAGGLIGYYALHEAYEILPYALAITAASLLYIAVADLIPGLHKRTDARAGIAQVALIAAGVAVIYFAEALGG